MTRNRQITLEHENFTVLTNMMILIVVQNFRMDVRQCSSNVQAYEEKIQIHPESGESTQ